MARNPGWGIASANKYDSIHTVERRRKKLLRSWDECKTPGTRSHVRMLAAMERLEGRRPAWNGLPFRVSKKRGASRVDVIDAVIRNAFPNEPFTWREINGFLIDHFPYWAQDRGNQVSGILYYYRKRLKIKVVGKGWRGHYLWARHGDDVAAPAATSGAP